LDEAAVFSSHNYKICPIFYANWYQDSSCESGVNSQIYC